MFCILVAIGATSHAKPYETINVTFKKIKSIRFSNTGFEKLWPNKSHYRDKGSSIIGGSFALETLIFANKSDVTITKTIREQFDSIKVLDITSEFTSADGEVIVALGGGESLDYCQMVAEKALSSTLILSINFGADGELLRKIYDLNKNIVPTLQVPDFIYDCGLSK